MQFLIEMFKLMERRRLIGRKKQVTSFEEYWSSSFDEKEVQFQLYCFSKCFLLFSINILDLDAYFGDLRCKR